MSKELSPLEAVKELYHEREYTYAESVNHKSKKWANDIKHYDNIGDCLSIIETALKKQEEDEKLLNEQAKSNRYLMEQIKQSQKENKAFEIIKEKNVDITTLLDCCNAEEYNRWVGVRSHYSYPPLELTQEEYDLVKEVLI